ncbi:MAG TPA: mechanosensitive ion channel domain-containing protein, partial [Vicinamibacterales bacterium]|nr:mechanosensitive ion channel domain-containing protein [Vicinamibacterales bacterium]
MTTPAWRVLRLTALLWIVFQAASAAQGVPPPADDVDVVTAPVTLDGAVLFKVRGASSFPAETRARLISERIAATAADRSIPITSLRAVALDSALRIDAGNQPLMAVIDADATLEGLSRAELAAAHLIQLKQAIAEYRDARTPQARWRSGVRSGIATVLFVGMIALVIALWRWIDRLMERRVQSRIHSVGIQSFEVMRAEQIRAALESMFLGVRIVVFVALVLAYAGYVLAQWPSTRTLARGTAGLVLDPLRTLGASFVADIPRFAFLAVLFVIVRSVLRMLYMFFDAVERGTVTLRKFEPEWAQPTYRIVRFAVIALSLVVAYPYIPGSESEAFKGVTLFIGVLFSLGSSTALSNLIAGYMMTYRRAFHVGDLVKIGDAIGIVMELRLQATHLRTYRNAEIVIPNSQI